MAATPSPCGPQADTRTAVHFFAWQEAKGACKTVASALVPGLWGIAFLGLRFPRPTFCIMVLAGLLATSTGYFSLQDTSCFAAEGERPYARNHFLVTR